MTYNEKLKFISSRKSFQNSCSLNYTKVIFNLVIEFYKF